MNENQASKTIRKRRGILLIVLYVAMEVALLGGAYVWWDSHCRTYLDNLAIMLTPLAFVYINSTCFGGTWPKTWSRKRWAVVAILWIAAVLLLSWGMEHL